MKLVGFMFLVASLGCIVDADVGIFNRIKRNVKGMQFSAGGISVQVASTSPPVKPKVKISRGRRNIKGIRVYFQRAQMNGVEPRFPVLLLHGAAFSSQTWRNLKTLRFLARQGYLALAIDLPGFGKTKTSYSGDTNSFINEVIASFKIERPVMVSPSMSGRYSIPYVLSHSDKLRGFIPVAPSLYGGSKDKFAALSLPALIIYGSRDYSGKRTSDILASIPGSTVKVIPNGSHPAYLDNPSLFHSFVKKFLDGIHSKEKEMKTPVPTEAEGSGQVESVSV